MYLESDSVQVVQRLLREAFQPQSSSSIEHDAPLPVNKPHKHTSDGTALIPQDSAHIGQLAESSGGKSSSANQSSTSQAHTTSLQGAHASVDDEDIDLIIIDVDDDHDGTDESPAKRRHIDVVRR